MTTPHPQPPLSGELARAVISAKTQPEVDKIVAEFREKRDREHPNWRETYDAQIKEWATHKGS